MDNKPELTLNTLDVIAAPQRPRSKRQCRKLSAMLAEIESIREAHWPDVLTLGQNVKPQPLLIVVVDKGEDVDAVSHHVSASLKRLFRGSDKIGVRILSSDDELLEAVRNAGCVLGWRD